MLDVKKVFFEVQDPKPVLLKGGIRIRNFVLLYSLLP